MRRFFYLFIAAVMALGVCSCNMKIENPKARNFVGTWDLQSKEIISPDGTVTTSTPKTLDYIVFTESTISFYDADKLSTQGSFAVKDNVIYVNGTACLNVVSLPGREMTLSQDGIGILVSEYRFHYKKR